MSETNVHKYKELSFNANVFENNIYSRSGQGDCKKQGGSTKFPKFNEFNLGMTTKNPDKET